MEDPFELLLEMAGSGLEAGLLEYLCETGLFLL
jgi:hypothetical protein